MKICWTKLTLAIVAIAMVAAMGSAASAELLKAYATRAVIPNDTGTNTHFFAALDDAGNTSLAFTTTAQRRLIKITYNAECAVLGPPQSWLSVTILVDGVEANPASGTDFGLCSALDPNNFQWTGAVRQSLIVVPNTGVHKLQVLVDLNNGATNWWLGDTSTVIEQQ